ncbi:hypothetical protein [Kitasatospora sp. CB02891]|uniref:hypothetical protein n=1 Tax=Kitasatospora sp. CB02891 TaxID=2020329 RepID=UPI000C2743A6|nr:hypothetical protein [Kitasatospora sp. CB02891]PJN24045.1 hypothetical protein CG736_19305 [Kitasatospora sp. CB02891]
MTDPTGPDDNPDAHIVITRAQLGGRHYERTDKIDPLYLYDPEFRLALDKCQQRLADEIQQQITFEQDVLPPTGTAPM